MQYRYAHYEYDDRYYRIVNEDEDIYLVENLYSTRSYIRKNECKNIVTYDLATGAAYHKQWKLTVEVIELDINDFQAPYRIRWVDELGQTHVTWADYNHIQPINY